mgnify:FL=1
MDKLNGIQTKDDILKQLIESRKMLNIKTALLIRPFGPDDNGYEGFIMQACPGMVRAWDEGNLCVALHPLSERGNYAFDITIDQHPFREGDYCPFCGAQCDWKGPTCQSNWKEVRHPCESCKTTPTPKNDYRLCSSCQNNEVYALNSQIQDLRADIKRLEQRYNSPFFYPPAQGGT